MPTYEYFCPDNGKYVEVEHGMGETITTWGVLAEKAGIDPGRTNPAAPVKRVFSAPGIASPLSNSRLKELGFTKLVKRDKGVYENVTATGNEKRYMKAGDPTSVPDIKRKIRD